MIETNRPLVYFENGADYNTQYTANNPNKDILAVFVGDTKKIYTHGVEFDCNNTLYDDTEVRGLISDHDDDIQGILDNIETLDGLIAGVQTNLNNIHNWSEDEIKTSVSNMLNDAQWLLTWAEANNIAIGDPFTVGALEDGLIQYGLITKDGNTTTVGWADLQAAYNQLSLSVQQLEQGEVDTEALKTELKQYIDNDTAIAQLTTYYATVDSQGQDIEWMLSGMKALAGQNETFVDLWSAATQRISGLESDVQGIAGLTTRVSTLENAGFVAEADLATKVSAAGFATTAGTVAKSDLDGSVAALFSSTSSTKTALDNKGYLTSSDLNGYATENYVNTAGFLTQTDLNLATAALFATNGTGTAAIQAYVADWWSGVTIAADKVNISANDINLNGQTWAQFIAAQGVTAGRVHVEGETQEHYTWYTDITDTNLHMHTLMTKNGTTNSDDIVICASTPPGTSYIKLKTDNRDSITIDKDGFHGIHHGDSIGNLYTTEDRSGTKIDYMSILVPMPQEEYGLLLEGDLLNFTNNEGTTVSIDGTNGHIDITGVLTATEVQAEVVNQTSDRNLKDIVSDTTLTVEQVANAPAVDFTWKRDADKADKKQNVGTIAQYWQVVLPEVVGQSKDGALTMQYSNAAMVSAIVTAKEVVALKEEIEELKRQIAELKAN